MSVGLEDDADPTFTHFAHRQEFLKSLGGFLALEIRREPTPLENDEEDRLVEQLGAILDHYLPLPGLLDPSLDEVVPPLLDKLSAALQDLTQDEKLSAERLQRLGRLINWVVKVRGWKAVVPHFPSSIQHLPVLVALLSPPTAPSSSSTPATPHHPLLSSQDTWELRAVLLLWLALLLTVPFNLSALSASTTTPSPLDLPASRLLFARPASSLARNVIEIALPLLHRPGKEGAYASLVLARLYSRSDAVDLLPGFLAWSKEELADGDREGEANFVASLFELLALLPGLVPHAHLEVLQSFSDEVLISHLRGGRTAAASGLVRKLAVKARGRWWMAKLGKDRADETDLPDGLEEQLDDLMNGLSDKDTIVRYSCAKYLARLTVLLPVDFADQIVLATIGLFAGTEDEPVIETPFRYIVDPGGTAASDGTMGLGGADTMRGEARWHGCCLAIAELARRGLVKGDEAVGQSVEWVLKALLFDLRRASHSIGANVRDAAAYLLWSLSRAVPAETIQPFAERIATCLISVACFDREVGVRRAASAAFQEGVGRLGIYPEGIDVLGKTDFYSVSVRRLAFTSAAAAVAQHKEYRDRMREHLHNITLRHWDPVMRLLGANSLRRVLELGSAEDLDDSFRREVAEVPSLDAVNVHGALVALRHITEMFLADDERRKQVLSAIGKIRPAALVSQQGAEIIQATCDLIAACLTPAIAHDSLVSELYGHYINLAMLRRESECYEAAGRMAEGLSRLKEVAKEVQQAVDGLRGTRASVRQMSALLLGSFRYGSTLDIVPSVVQALLRQLELSTKADVETRRYSIGSLANVVAQEANGRPSVSSTLFTRIVTACIAGLDDYSTDQRGDVGSWVRIASISALAQAVDVASRQVQPKEWISQAAFDLIIGGIVKQGAEKLEPVRAASWRAWRRMSACSAADHWDWEGALIWSFTTPDDSDEAFRYIPLKSWYLSAMPILTTKHRSALVAGLLFSIGSQVESVAGVAFSALKDFLKDHTDGQSLTNYLLQDLHAILSTNLGQNRIFIPALSTVTRILSDNDLKSFCTSSQIMSDLLAVITKGVAQFKSIERILASMRCVLACLSLPTSRSVPLKAADSIAAFLGHRFPRVRTVTAEALYLALSDRDEDIHAELEEVLLETDWASSDTGTAVSRTSDLVREGLVL